MEQPETRAGSQPVPVVKFPSGEPDPSGGRFCVNCRWCDTDKLTCHAPQSFTESTSLVTGGMMRAQKYKYCEVHRQNPHRKDGDNCGIEAAWFEPRIEQVAAE